MRPFLFLGLACLMIGISPLKAQTLQVKLSFHDAVSMAWSIDPVRTALQVGHRSAKARANAAGSWFAGGPTLSGEYMDDHAIGSNEGYTTYQGGVSVPLWLPGQGSATRDVAGAESESINEQLNVEHMVLAIKVLETVAALQIAQARLHAANDLYGATNRISQTVTHAVHNGELAQSDRQMAQAGMENARNEQAMAQEAMNNAVAEQEALLGRFAEVDFVSGEGLAHARFVDPRDMEDNDPRIKVVHRNVEAAEANMKLARRSFMPNPEIGIDAIHEKQYGSPWDDRVGVNFSIPLPSEVRNTPIMSEASNRLATANSEEIQAHRMVHLEITRVRERLLAATIARQTTHVAAANLGKRAEAQERAWRVGEVALNIALQARQDACTAQLASAREEIEWRVATIRMLLAMGVVP